MGDPRPASRRRTRLPASELAVVPLNQGHDERRRHAREQLRTLLRRRIGARQRLVAPNPPPRYDEVYVAGGTALDAE